MYAEMLAGGMVPDENRGMYLETLRIEADRLSHLVDNVLQYARLERGRSSPPRESLAVDELVNRVTTRLGERAQHAGLRLECEVNNSAQNARLRIDAGAFEQIAFNLIDNACKYAANGTDSRVHLEVSREKHEVVWRFRDHGPGIPPAGLRRLFQPFSKTVQEAALSVPGVGLGLALSHRLARELGGTLELERSDSQGTVFALRTPIER
jgi:signal transduction histidine kinase